MHRLRGRHRRSSDALLPALLRRALLRRRVLGTLQGRPQGPPSVAGSRQRPRGIHGYAPRGQTAATRREIALTRPERPILPPFRGSVRSSKKEWVSKPFLADKFSTKSTGGYTQNGTFSEFCILSRHLDRFCSSKRPRGPRGPPELPNDKKTAAPRLLDRLLFRYPPPQIRLKWDVLSVTFNGKFQR